MQKIRIPENLTTLAYETIREFIWEGRLEQGPHLTEDFLAVRLGISKSPIHEALNRLEAEGLIRIEPRRGAYLRTFTAKEIQDLYDFREALESHAVASLTVTPELLRELRLSVARANRFIQDDAKRDYIEEDIRFHRLIADAAGNERIAHALENIQQQVWIFRRKTYDLSRSKAVVAHTRIVDALAAGNKSAARRIMRNHMTSVCGRLVAFVKSPATAERATSPAARKGYRPGRRSANPVAEPAQTAR
jgi:DNA-binding GntR family transcriptional regulator